MTKVYMCSAAASLDVRLQIQLVQRLSAVLTIEIQNDNSADLTCDDCPSRRILIPPALELFSSWEPSLVGLPCPNPRSLVLTDWNEAKPRSGGSSENRRDVGA